MNLTTFYDRTDAHYYGDHAAQIASYCKTYWPEEVAHILRVADEVCENYFLFDLKWDMERTYEPAVFGEKIDWNYMPADDPEFIWQFNRHRFFICLGQAYALTGDEKYANAFVRQLLGWIKDVPLTDANRPGPWRTLETGLRGENWNKALRYFRNSPAITPAFLEAFEESMHAHARHLMANHSPYRYMSNWGVIENHGLFEISVMLPQSERTKEYQAFALRNLEIEARMQIAADGVQWEQSPMYHNEVLHCFYDVIILARRNGIPLPDSFVDATKRMVYANLAWKKPNHHQVMMGDSDDTDIRDLISVGAYLFEDPVLKFGGLDRLDFESVWDLGITAAQAYEKLPKKAPDFTSICLSDTGNTYIRSSWEEDADFLHLHSGTLGAGHGHSDKLHIDLVIGGEDVLMDAGRYTYVAGPQRYAFKDPDAHNTITVDDTFFTVCKDSWECSKLAQPVKQQLIEKNGYVFTQAGHLGYMDQKGGVYANRKVISLGHSTYVFVDELYTGDVHTYRQYFHFNNEGTVQVGNNQATYLGEKIAADFYFLTQGTQTEATPSQLSRNYNQAEDNICVRNTLEGDGFTSFLTVVHGHAKVASDQMDKADQMEQDAQQGAVDFSVEKVPVRSALKGITYPDYMAEAVKLTVAGKTYVVVVCHQEVNTPTDLVEVEGCMGYGNVIVFEPAVDTLVGTVLNW